MKIVVYSDIHLGATHAIKDYDLFKEAEKENVFFTGDIYDSKNTKKKELSKFLAERDKLKEIAGDRYIFGNHECIKPERYYYAKDGMLFCHGHTLYWSDEKVKRWEKKKPGKSNFQYYLYGLKHLFVKRGGKSKLSFAIKEKCYDLCKLYKCHTIVFGHTHKYCDIRYKDVRIINAPRGKLEFE